ncbi:2-dehydropantoate 2-reductase [Pseudomassariella vexata]|uniref:2-dehydropantoate 2-reductase n=1 Tax=Pseudomassariella vexata TaxID=1141098 RepID=A0A1Y2EFK3_9PEZI|nr:2-dehydropantoate 2-reductase [Pseudomassariella vexata]ORY69575.1 2-dehydropantoate 2-reductase [Pseudomassariella vexata]
MAPRILVFGTGSVGAVYAWVLSQTIPATSITTICRSNYDQASKDGFAIDSTIWGNNLKFKPVVARTVAEAAEKSDQPFDHVLVCSKALNTTPSTAELIKPAISETTAIVLIQNGIGIEDEYARVYPNNPLISTLTYLPVTQVSPAVIQHREVELLHAGTYPADAPSPSKDAAKKFVDLLTAAGATAVLHDDVQEERWAKLLVNVAWNPVCALTRCRDRAFINTNNKVLPFIKDVMMEVCSVAQAYGYDNVNEQLAHHHIGRAYRRDLPGVQPSMMADTLAGREMEVDAIIGNVVKRARAKGVAVPLLRTIYLLVNGLNASFAVGNP